VHATPVGQEEPGAPDSAHACLVDPGWITPGSLVLDLVYRPPETELLRRAAAVGAVPIGGLSVFLQQALAQVRHVLVDADGLPGPETLARLLGPDGRSLRGPPCLPQ
jgi:shikimate 5-dehydrogenase